MTGSDDLSAILFESISRNGVVPRLLNNLRDAGFAVWLVGGVVRDCATGRDSADIDIVTNKDPVEAARDFATGMGFVVLDDERRIVRIVVDESLEIDIAKIQGDTIDDDLARRDFTVNAVAAEWSARGLEIYDPLGGLADLKNGLLRLAGADSIREDPVRILRAYRFALTHDLRVADEVKPAITAALPYLTDAPGERISQELSHILRHRDTSSAIVEMERGGVLRILFPELEATRGVAQNEWHHLDVFDHTLECVRCLESMIADFPSWLSPWEESFREELASETGSGFNKLSALKLAMLYHDTGKPDSKETAETGKVTFYEHEKASEEYAGRMAERLRLPNTVTSGIRLLVRGHLRPFISIQEQEISRRSIFRFLRDFGEWATSALLHALADAEATRGVLVTKQRRDREKATVVEIMKFRDTLLAERTRTEPPVNGRHIMERFGIPPGPMIGKILNEIKESFAIGEIETFDQAMQVAENIIRNDS